MCKALFNSLNDVVYCTSQCNCFGNFCFYDLKLQLAGHSVDHFKTMFRADVESVLLGAKRVSVIIVSSYL